MSLATPNQLIDLHIDYNSCQNHKKMNRLCVLPNERPHSHLPSSKGTDHRSEKYFALVADLQEIQRTEEPDELYRKDIISKIQTEGNATVMGISGG